MRYNKKHYDKLLGKIFEIGELKYFISNLSKAEGVWFFEFLQLGTGIISYQQASITMQGYGVVK
jgi:hypothetical protein